MPEQCNICLYQPYYKSKGHFSDYFDRFAAFLQAHTNCNLYGVLESDADQKRSNRIRLHSFQPTLKTEKRSVLNNLDALFTLHNRIPKCNIYHFLDAELFLLFLYLLVFRSRYQDSTIVITQHSTNSYTNSFGKKTYRRFIKAVYKLARKKLQICFITNGRAIGENLQQFFDIPPANIQLSEWGADIVDANTDEAKTPNSFLVAGMLRKDKGLELLTRVLPEISSPLRLTIAGYPVDYTSDEIRNMFSSKPDQIEINFQLTYLNNSSFHRLLHSHEFLIIPYKPENKSSSGPLLQGLLSGIIPIVSDYGERGRIVNEYASGISFEYTENSLKKALHRALDIPAEEKRRMVLHNKNLSGTFSWNAIFREYTNAYVRWSGITLIEE